MLRKLIVFAVTTGLAKKAYDMYKEKNSASGVRDVTARTPSSRGPVARAKSDDSKPDAS
ncbi:MAG: hypothetical protein JWQ33_1586 [Ramlibacter sp.]|nr:hypothetical protein [Ramlibacter sp.]